MMKTAFNIVGGLLAAAYLVSYILPDRASEAPTPDVAETDMELTLADYMAMSKSDREGLVSAHIQRSEIDASLQEDFVRCLGAYAPDKSPELKLADVFGWCVAEWQRDDPKFAEHYNQLDAPDLSAMASVICERHVKGKLIAPATADFPWLPDAVFDEGRQRYQVKSHVDAQNSFGAKIRLYYTCVIQHDMVGDAADNSAWVLQDLEVIQP